MTKTFVMNVIEVTQSEDGTEDHNPQTDLELDLGDGSGRHTRLVLDGHLDIKARSQVQIVLTSPAPAEGTAAPAAAVEQPAVPVEPVGSPASDAPSPAAKAPERPFFGFNQPAPEAKEGN